MTGARHGGTLADMLTAREFIAQAIDGHTLSAVSRAADVPYTSLHEHVTRDRPLSVKNARKLETWSLKRYPDEPAKRISAAKILGLAT